MSQQENPVSLFFRAKLQSLLDEKGVSQRQLALATGVSQQTVNNYLRGVTKLPGAEELLSLSRYFGIPMEHFLTTPIEDTSNLRGKKLSASPRSIPALEVQRAAERMRRQAENLLEEAERLKKISSGV